MLFPKQGKACEALGFALPDPDKRESAKNNRKISFDAEVRKLFIEIAEKHGVVIEKIPLEGKTHKETNDFILAKQAEEIKVNQEKLDTMQQKLSSLDAFADELAKNAYEKAVEAVTDTVREETTKAHLSLIKQYGDRLKDPKSGHTKAQITFADWLLKGLMDLLRRKSATITASLKKLLNSPEVKQKHQEKVAQTTKDSILDYLKKAKKEAMEEDTRTPRHTVHRDTERS